MAPGRCAAFAGLTPEASPSDDPGRNPVLFRLDAGTFEDGRQAIEVAGTTLHFTRAHSGEKQIVRLGGRSYELRATPRAWKYSPSNPFAV